MLAYEDITLYMTFVTWCVFANSHTNPINNGAMDEKIDVIKKQILM